jgi:hypothetical protein
LLILIFFGEKSTSGWFVDKPALKTTIFITCPEQLKCHTFIAFGVAKTNNPYQESTILSTAMLITRQTPYHTSRTTRFAQGKRIMIKVLSNNIMCTK